MSRPRVVRGDGSLSNNGANAHLKELNAVSKCGGTSQTGSDPKGSSPAVIGSRVHEETAFSSFSVFCRLIDERNTSDRCFRFIGSTRRLR